MNPGTCVKYSDFILRPMRDYWLGRGRHDEKSRAKQWLDEKKAERGTVILAGKTQFGPFLEIKWDNGTTSKSMPA